jgi:hypothetical protein
MESLVEEELIGLVGKIDEKFLEEIRENFSKSTSVNSTIKLKNGETWDNVHISAITDKKIYFFFFGNTSGNYGQLIRNEVKLSDVEKIEEYKQEVSWFENV